MERIKEDTTKLTAFLKAMPKGSDLHTHLSGAVYAESYLEWAKADGLCIDSTWTLVNCTTATARPVAEVARDTTIEKAIIDAWSMRNFRPGKEHGHDHFFGTFGKFNAVTARHACDMLAEAVDRAAEHHVDHIEFIYAPDNGLAKECGKKLKVLGKDLVKERQRVLDLGLRDALPSILYGLDSLEQGMRRLMRTPPQDHGHEWAVDVRYLYQVSRKGKPEEVFAQLVCGFELAERDPRMVGFNLVQPEHDKVAMAQFEQEMRMIAALRPLYQRARISLHAGELSTRVVERDSLCCHIRRSIETGHAERIGHGVTLAHDRDPSGLLHLMRERNVLVEICLTSNDAILGVKQQDHPFRKYLDAGVPLALCTDDEGVSRSNITQEYVKAVRDQNASYAELKELARNSLEHAFVPGEGLWEDRSRTIMACGCSLKDADERPVQRCLDLLDRNAKARLQWELERSFQRFEADPAYH